MVLDYFNFGLAAASLFCAFLVAVAQQQTQPVNLKHAFVGYAKSKR